MWINLNVVVDQKQVVMSRLDDREIALARAVSFRVMKVTNVKSCFAPPRLVRHRQCF